MNKTQILIITLSHIWYDTRVYYKVCKSLLKKDVQIHIITGNPDNNATFTPDEGLTVEFIPSKSKQVQITKFISKGLKIKPDIVICIEPLTLMSGYILKKRLGCRLVYDCHEYFAEAFGEKYRYLAKPYEKYEMAFAKRADAIITVNDILVNTFKRVNSNTYLCANLPNKEIFKKTRGTSKHYDLAYIGSISFERGLKVYLQTAKLFKKNNKGFKFLIVGPFKNKSTEKFFFDYIAQHELTEYVVYKAYMPNADALKEMKASKIGIFFGDLSKSPRYNKAISMKTYEYMSQSIPIVINKLDMLSELINAAQCGWIIDYSPVALYDLINEVRDDDTLLKKLGKAGYDYASQNLHWEQNEATLYKAVFGEKVNNAILTPYV